MNHLIDNINTQKDIIYFIVLGDWIKEACTEIYKLYEKYTNNFVGSVKNFVALVKNGSFLVRITDMTILIENLKNLLLTLYFINTKNERFLY